jgi:hypothetical protein
MNYRGFIFDVYIFSACEPNSAATIYVCFFLTFHNNPPFMPLALAIATTTTVFERISRTVGKDQVVDELILKFTHDREIEYMIPGIPPTGKYVELPHVVVMKFVGTKIAHEHIYWDQASLLAQIGLWDTNSLPVKGIEQSRKLQELADQNKTKTVISKQLNF